MMLNSPQRQLDMGIFTQSDHESRQVAHVPYVLVSISTLPEWYIYNHKVKCEDVDEEKEDDIEAINMDYKIITPE